MCKLTIFSFLLTATSLPFNTHGCLGEIRGNGQIIHVMGIRAIGSILTLTRDDEDTNPCLVELLPEE